MSPHDSPNPMAASADTRGARRRAGLLVAAFFAAVVSACGGGGDAGGDTSGSTGADNTATAYAAGPISGFGSIIVNGVRYDDSTASVSDDDGSSHARTVLKLGMMVEVDGSGVAAGSGKALRIRFGSELVGPVASVDTAAGTLVVLGQTVEVQSTTVFDDSITGGLAGLAAGTVVEVHAIYDATSGHYRATRVEAETGATAYRLRGTVANLNTTARTFTIGGATIDYTGVSDANLPTGFADGAKVRVKLQTAQVNGNWVATAIGGGVKKLEDRAEAHLRGAITAFTSTSDFEVNGVKVDASAATFDDGTTGIVLGARVEVEGRITNGVLVATKVELDDGPRSLERHRFELHGSITSIDTAAKTFVLRGVTVSYGGSVTYTRGTEATLVVGAKVEVKGVPSSDRTTLTATSIKFES